MPMVIRFGVSMEESLLSRFDALISSKGYASRSEAIRDLVREELVRQEWLEGEEVAGTITFVYDHHTRELAHKLLAVQHDAGRNIIASQHVHLDHHNCLEVLVVKGKPKEVQRLAGRIKAARGVKHCLLSMTTTGKHVP